MTSLRIAFPVLPRRHHRRRPHLRLPSPRWIALAALGAMLGAIGGTSLFEMIAMMLLRVLFIAFSTAFLIIFFVVGMAWARKASSA
ncbi:MAG: hypothetical protein V4558_12620 [Gemmatimonadota bacterium]